MHGCTKIKDSFFSKFHKYYMELTQESHRTLNVQFHYENVQIKEPCLILQSKINR